MLKEQIIPAAISYLGSSLKVNRLPILKIDSRVASFCGSVTPPKELSEGVPFDLVVFIMGRNDSDSSSAASSRPCVLMAPTDRYRISPNH